MRLQLAEIILSIVTLLLAIYETRQWRNGQRSLAAPQPQGGRKRLRGSKQKLGSNRHHQKAATHDDEDDGRNMEEGGDVASPSVKFAQSATRHMTSATIAQKLTVGEVALQDFFPKKYERVGPIVVIPLDSKVQPLLTVEALKIEVSSRIGSSASGDVSGACKPCLAEHLAIALSSPSIPVTCVVTVVPRTGEAEVVWMNQTDAAGQCSCHAMDVLTKSCEEDGVHSAEVEEKDNPELETKKKSNRGVSRPSLGVTGHLRPEEVAVLQEILQRPTFTTVDERELRYSFDVLMALEQPPNGVGSRKCTGVSSCKFFSPTSGFVQERSHLASPTSGPRLKADEVIVDMFAGIGQWTVPLARKPGSLSTATGGGGGPHHHVYCIEQDETRCNLLRFNCEQNKVSDHVTVIKGDNRVVGSELLDKVDRVVMGRGSLQPGTTTPGSFPGSGVGKASGRRRASSERAHSPGNSATSSSSPSPTGAPIAEQYLFRAVAFLKKTAKTGLPIGTVHYHFVCHDKSKIVARSVAHNHVIRQCGEDLVQHFDVQEIRTLGVASASRGEVEYGPNAKPCYHHVADIVFAPILTTKMMK